MPRSSPLRTPAGKLYAPVPVQQSAHTKDKKRFENLRGRHMFASLKTSYSVPALLVEARGQFMYDENGNEYLDCYNNIPHIGHCHPDFVAASKEQMEHIVTNTRYLHGAVAELSQQLCARLPPSLSVVMFTNSGSEANDLAMRIARGYTKNRGMICLEGAYHGTTTECTKISPHPFYCEGRDLVDLSNVEVVPSPDAYRGLYRGTGADVGAKYGKHVEKAAQALKARGHGVAAFIAETIQGCGGQIVYPPGFLASAFAATKAAGGITIADEVQVGFGRVGSHYWAFEAEGVVPDILTVGKSFGNGLPLAALVTTKAIADSFSGHEYFSSVAGNPVSACAGLAVLRAVEEDGLQSNALAVGNHLLREFAALKPKHRLVGDVRGRGLFLGIELVRDHTTLEPADKETSELKELLYARRLLTGTLGIYNNVLRLKPPMCFTIEDANVLVRNIDECLTIIESKPARSRL